MKYFSVCPCKSESILMLSTWTYSNVPMTVDFTGKNLPIRNNGWTAGLIAPALAFETELGGHRFHAVSMSTPRFPKNFVSMPHPWPWRGHGHRCPLSSCPCPSYSAPGIQTKVLSIKSTESCIKETLTMTLISNMKKKLLFVMGVRQLCMMNFGISAAWILLYVRFADLFKFSVSVGKPTDILRQVKSSIANWNDNRILNLIFMVALVILSRILNQRFYFALTMNTLTNVIRKYSLSFTVSVWSQCGTFVNQGLMEYLLVKLVQVKKATASHLEWEIIKIWHWQGIHRPNV